jgi:ribose transport system ATP-binding protein
MPNEVVLELKNINKSFSGVQVLYDINLEIRKGEVHVLVGENGAGKSTLMKIISGVYERDSGEIIFEGKPVGDLNASVAQDLGVSIIHQEFNILPHRTVCQNIFLGREPIKNERLGIVDYKDMIDKSAELLKHLGLDIDPRRKVLGLGVAQQQMIEVAKAISFQSKILIMDEPTATLTNKEMERLFDMIKRLKGEGVAIIYISHRLEELKQIADRITVLRDGHTVHTANSSEIGINEIIKLMVGREITNQYKRDFNPPGDEILRIEDLSSLRFRNANLSVHRGEIVGISGLVGAGRTELAKAIFGDEPIERGNVRYCGTAYSRMSTVKASRLRIGFVPEDRKEEGTAINFPLRENIVQASLHKIFPTGILSRRKEQKYAEKYVHDMNIKTTSINKPVYLLSGGNQQKVVVSKWLCAECDFIIFDEPTRGIDVGARAEIYSIMNDFIKSGKAILMISSDLPELLGMCDRIYVMKDGELVSEFSHDNATQEEILAHSV